MNSIARVSTGSIDQSYGYGTLSCASNPCYRLHNGGIVASWASVPYSSGNTGVPYSANDTTGIIYFFDPDGTTDGTTNSPGKSLAMVLYYNGRVTSYTGATGGASDPAWFRW